ncbi:MAG: Ig-like domain-containing protein, partial [Candidatus Saccharibacteria bacterium]
MLYRFLNLTIMTNQSTLGAKNKPVLTRKSPKIAAFVAVLLIFGWLTPNANPVLAADFPSRCTAPGVAFCTGLDSDAEIDPFLMGVTFPETNLPAFSDSLHKSSGDGSLLFQTLLPDETYSGAFSRIIDESSQGFGAGDTFYVQFRQAFSPEMFNSTLTDNGWRDATLTSSFGSYGDPLDFGIKNDSFSNYPQFYSGSVSYPQAPADNIPIPYAIDQWMTFYLKVTVGQWGQPDSTVDFWVAQENQPLKQVNHLTGLVFSRNPNDSDSGINQILLGPDIARSAVDAPAYAWYDEVIVSRQPIADPYSVIADTTPPTVPAGLAGHAVSANALDLNWSASTDNTAVAGYKIFRNGNLVQSATGTTFHDTGLTPDTQYSYEVSAFDAANNESARSTAANIRTAALPDVIAPTANITFPANNATLSDAVIITANASDNVGVAGVQFKVDGTILGSEDTASPYSAAWDTKAAANGSHTIIAVARDAAGNTASSPAIQVTVNNADTVPPSVSIASPADGAQVSGVAPINAIASDNIGVSGVQFKIDGVNVGPEDTSAPYSAAWDTTAASNGTHSITAVARDAAGNKKTSAAVTVTVTNADSTKPTVNFSAPNEGATLSGSAVAITATASDNVGVTGVQFMLDGNNLSSADTTAPYSLTWDSTLTANGDHTLSAVAKDAANNSATATVAVIVNNFVDTEAPTVPVNLTASATSASHINLAWSAATDNVAVTGYRIYRNGTQIGNGTTTSFGDNGLASGTTYAYTVAAYDAAGNLSAQSAAVNATTQTSGGGGGGGGNGNGGGGGSTGNNGKHNGKGKGSSIISGRLVKYASDPTVYVLSDGKKNPIVSFGVYQKNFQNRPIATISDSEQYPTGDAVRYSGGTLVKTADSEQIYLILGNGTRYAFRSMDEFARFGYTLSQVRTVNQGDLDSYPLSDLNALP